MEEKEEKIRSKIIHLHGYQVIHNEWQSLLEVVDWFYFSYSGHYTYWKQTGEMGRPALGTVSYGRNCISKLKMSCLYTS